MNDASMGADCGNSMDEWERCSVEAQIHTSTCIRLGDPYILKVHTMFSEADIVRAQFKRIGSEMCSQVSVTPSLIRGYMTTSAMGEPKHHQFDR